MKNATGLDMADGFYDKYLEKHPNLHAVAIAFELQMYRELPFEEHDIKPEKVVTEKQSYPLDTEEKVLYNKKGVNKRWQTGYRKILCCYLV